jgi:BirA family biotin operon repressor/biotin-[acetyl-CoA-carboxylase] ligase
MIVLTDMGNQALTYLGCPEGVIQPLDPDKKQEELPLLTDFFRDRALHKVDFLNPDLDPDFPLALLIENSGRSNLEILSALHRAGVTLPEGLVCLANRGKGFLGRHDRSWCCEAGNLHVVVRLKPDLEPAWAGCAFSILAAIACVDALDHLLPGAEAASIKWINDVQIGNRKIAGVLTRQTYKDPKITDVFLGLGINVLTDPVIPPDPFVTGSGCLADLFPQRSWSPGEVLVPFLRKVRDWSEVLRSRGIKELIDYYRSRASILDRRVMIFEDGYGFEADSLSGRKLLAAGKVQEIREDLALRIEGTPHWINTGRLAFEEDCEGRI